MSHATVWQLKKGGPGAPFVYAAFCKEQRRQRFFETREELGGFLEKQGAPHDVVASLLASLDEGEGSGPLTLEIPTN